MNLKLKQKKSKEYYAFEFLKTMIDSDKYTSYKKGQIVPINNQSENYIMNELINKGHSGFYSGHNFMSLTSKEVRIRKFMEITKITRKEIKCDKKVKR